MLKKMRRAFMKPLISCVKEGVNNTENLLHLSLCSGEKKKSFRTDVLTLLVLFLPLQKISCLLGFQSNPENRARLDLAGVSFHSPTHLRLPLCLFSCIRLCSVVTKMNAFKISCMGCKHLSKFGK